MISGTEQDTDTAIIHGECALEALLGYTTELRSMTQGRGQFTMDYPDSTSAEPGLGSRVSKYGRRVASGGAVSLTDLLDVVSVDLKVSLIQHTEVYA